MHPAICNSRCNSIFLSCYILGHPCNCIRCFLSSDRVISRIKTRSTRRVVATSTSRKRKYTPRCVHSPMFSSFFSFPILIFAFLIRHSALCSAWSEVVLFAVFYFLPSIASRAKLIDRRRDYHSKNDAAPLEPSQENMLNCGACARARIIRTFAKKYDLRTVCFAVCDALVIPDVRAAVLTMRTMRSTSAVTM